MGNETTRRGLFKGAMTAAAFAALPVSIQKALATPAAVRTGTIEDVKHIVILMQENRSFDMYFGTKRGVRGFGDPFPPPTVSGRPAWYQMSGPSATAQTTLPFPILQSDNWAFPPDLPHGIDTQQAAWVKARLLIGRSTNLLLRWATTPATSCRSNSPSPKLLRLVTTTTAR
jgi:phospholipase C